MNKTAITALSQAWDNMLCKKLKEISRNNTCHLEFLYLVWNGVKVKFSQTNSRRILLKKTRENGNFDALQNVCS